MSEHATDPERDHLRDVRHTAKHANAWTERKEDAMIDAYDAGYSTRQIGDAAGVSHMAVQRLIGRVTEGDTP